MKTKILYTLTSSNKDIYLEQLWVSLTSLRIHNANAFVTLITDKDTDKSLTGNRRTFLNMVNEYIVVDMIDGYSQKEMSRYIKTTARQWVKGDFLFLDTDTIISGELNEIDNLEGDIQICPEFHCTLNDNPMRDGTIERAYDIFSTDISKCKYFYNSGVIYCKDSPLAHKFYSEWNKNWSYSSKYKGVNFDQPALAKTVADFNDEAVRPLDGEYHCQIALSIKYLHRAKIIHFFNMKWFRETIISPFFGTKIYEGIKEKGIIDEELVCLIKDVKNQFDSVSVVVGKKEFNLLVDYGRSLMLILTEDDNKLKRFCAFMIKKVIRLYWIMKKFQRHFI